jgi:hypothetical protein
MSPTAKCQNENCGEEIFAPSWFNLLVKESNHVRANERSGIHWCRVFTTVVTEGQLENISIGFDFYAHGQVSRTSASLEEAEKELHLTYSQILVLIQSDKETK